MFIDLIKLIIVTIQSVFYLIKKQLCVKKKQCVKGYFSKQKIHVNVLNSDMIDDYNKC